MDVDWWLKEMKRPSFRNERLLKIKTKNKSYVQQNNSRKSWDHCGGWSNALPEMQSRSCGKSWLELRHCSQDAAWRWLSRLVPDVWVILGVLGGKIGKGFTMFHMNQVDHSRLHHSFTDILWVILGLLALFLPICSSRPSQQSTVWFPKDEFWSKPQGHSAQTVDALRQEPLTKDQKSRKNPWW